MALGQPAPQKGRMSLSFNDLPNSTPAASSAILCFRNKSVETWRVRTYKFCMGEERAVSPESVGARIRRARERLGLTQIEVSEASGVGNSSLSEIENGKREPAISQLKKLEPVLHVTIADLLSSNEQPSPRVRWRMRPDACEATEARFLQRCRQYFHLERWAGEERPIQIQRSEEYPVSYVAVERLAKSVSNTLTLGDRPGLLLRKKLEDDCAFKLFHARIEPSGTAACTWHPEFGPAVLLNALNSPARRTFDLAHELFHLLTWDLAAPDESIDEKFADCFASALLLPDDAVRDALERRLRDNKISTENLCELARDFGVSVDAFLWRVHRIYRWNEDHTRDLIERTRCVMVHYRDLTPDRDENAPELPERYRGLAIQALRAGEISTGRFAEYLSLRRWEAMKYTEQVGEDETISLPPA